MRGFRKEAFPSWRGDQVWRDRLPGARAALHRRCPQLDAAIAQLPFAEFEAASINEAVTASYLQVAPQLLQRHAALPADVRAPYLCALLIWNMEHFEPRFAATGLDGEFAFHYADAFHRILDQIACDPAFAVIDRDAFLKDLWLTRAVMIPAFAQVWWPRAGLSTTEVLRAGAGTMAHVMLRCGGLSPFLEGHTHDPTAKAYWNPDGWAEAMRLGALALQAMPGHRGIFGTAWFYDPALAQVTPRLAYTAQMQVSQGAYRFRVGPSASAIQNATATSASRRELHARGEYLPTDYTVLWARQDLLAAYGPSSAEPLSAA